MRTTALLPGLALLLASGCAEQPNRQAAAPSCLRSDMIDHTSVPNNRTILFQMRDGAVWQNTLPGPCVGLDFPGGFAYATAHDEICANADVVRVLTDGNRCLLGSFTPAPPVR